MLKKTGREELFLTAMVGLCFRIGGTTKLLLGSGLGLQKRVRGGVGVRAPTTDISEVDWYLRFLLLRERWWREKALEGRVASTSFLLAPSSSFIILLNRRTERRCFKGGLGQLLSGGTASSPGEVFGLHWGRLGNRVKVPEVRFVLEAIRSSLISEEGSSPSEHSSSSEYRSSFTLPVCLPLSLEERSFSAAVPRLTHLRTGVISLLLLTEVSWLEVQFSFGSTKMSQQGGAVGMTSVVTLYQGVSCWEADSIQYSTFFSSEKSCYQNGKKLRVSNL